MIPVYSRAGHDDCDNQSKEADGLCEDENQDHADEELWLDCVHSHTNISHDTNSETRSLTNSRTIRIEINKIILTRAENPQHMPETRCLYPLALV